MEREIKDMWALLVNDEIIAIAKKYDFVKSIAAREGLVEYVIMPISGVLSLEGAVP